MLESSQRICERFQKFKDADSCNERRWNGPEPPAAVYLYSPDLDRNERRSGHRQFLLPTEQHALCYPIAAGDLGEARTRQQSLLPVFAVYPLRRTSDDDPCAQVG